MPLRTLTLLTLLASPLFAHDGRRFELGIADNRLAARGVITGGVDDGGGLVRPYNNAIHDHWTNLSGGPGAMTMLPGFDLPDPGPLVGEQLTLTFMRARKWDTPPIMPAPDLVPSLTTLDPQEAIRMELGSVLVSSETPGRTLGVFSDIPSAGLHDIDPTYSIGLHPADVIYVLEFQLSTTAAGIAASDPVHVLLSPDGATPAERLHHATLHLERYLGTPVPEPATGTLLALPLIATALFRRRPG